MTKACRHHHVVSAWESLIRYVIQIYFEIFDGNLAQMERQRRTNRGNLYSQLGLTLSFSATENDKEREINQKFCLSTNIIMGFLPNAKILSTLDLGLQMIIFLTSKASLQDCMEKLYKVRYLAALPLRNVR